jgi:iron complex outermembrane receptor protein
MSRSHLACGASVAVLCLIFVRAGSAQEALPTIDIAAESAAPRARHAAQDGPASAAPSGTGLQPPNSKLQLDTRTATSSRLGLTPRQTPSSIVILDNATIRARGANTTQEALSRAPGVIVSQQPGSAGTACMRGFCNTDVTQLINGIDVAYGGVAARPVDSWTLDRIEVLGGASSYLWGQGAVGGAINYVSKIANREQQGFEAMGLIGMFFNRRTAIGYNGQIGDTPNWIQVAASYSGSDGYVERTPHNAGDFSLSWLTDVNSQLSNTVAVEFHLEERDGYWGTPLLNPVFGGNVYPLRANGLPVFDARIAPGTRYKNLNSVDPMFDQQVLMARNITEYRHSDSLQFKNTFYFYRADRQWENVEAGSYNTADQVFGGVTYPANSLINREEAFAVRHIHSLIGNRTEMFHQDTIFGLPTQNSSGVEVSWNDQTRNPSLSNPSFSSTVLPYGFTGGVPYDFIPGESGWIGGARGQLRTIALFAENRTTLLPRLNLVTGIRWEDIEYSRTNFRTPTPGTVTNPIGDPAFFRREYQPLTWRAALSYDLMKDVNVYATYSTAANPPAGYILTGTPAQLLGFGLSTGWQAEGGAKFDFLDGRGSATIAGYFIERNNIATRTGADRNVVTPIGKVASNGIELNAGYQLTPEISVQANAAWTNAKFVSFNESGTLFGTPLSLSRAGNRPINIPRWTANAFVTWQFMPEWQWQFNTRFVGDRFANTGNTVRLSAYTLFDTAISWSPKGLPFGHDTTFTARLKNITDAQWFEWGQTFNNVALIGAPRTFEMSMYTKF